MTHDGIIPQQEEWSHILNERNVCPLLGTFASARLSSLSVQSQGSRDALEQPKMDVSSKFLAQVALGAEVTAASSHIFLLREMCFPPTHRMFSLLRKTQIFLLSSRV